MFQPSWKLFPEKFKQSWNIYINIFHLGTWSWSGHDTIGDKIETWCYQTDYVLNIPSLSCSLCRESVEISMSSSRSRQAIIIISGIWIRIWPQGWWWMCYDICPGISLHSRALLFWHSSSSNLCCCWTLAVSLITGQGEATKDKNMFCCCQYWLIC